MIKTEQVQPNILDSLKLDQAIRLATKKAKDGNPEEARRIYQDRIASIAGKFG